MVFKKLLKFSALSFVLPAFTLFAPEARALMNPFSYGVKGGFGLSTQSITTSAGTSATGLSYKTGVIGGGSVDFGFGPLGITADLLYAHRAYGIGSLASVSTNRLEVPVMGRFSMGMLTVMGGAYYAMGLGNVSATALGVTTSASYADAGVSKSDMGLCLGAGLSIPVGLFSMGAELRYSYGLANMTAIPVGDASTQHRSLDLLVSFYF